MPLPPDFLAISDLHMLLMHCYFVSFEILSAIVFGLYIPSFLSINPSFDIDFRSSSLRAVLLLTIHPHESWQQNVLMGANSQAACLVSFFSPSSSTG